MARPRKKNVYAVYRGDEMLGMGTADELAEKMGVKRDTVLWLSTPAAHRRANDRRMVAYKIEEEE